MPLRTDQLEDAIVKAVRGIANAHTRLLKDNEISIEVAEIDIQAQMVYAENGLALQSITATPARTSEVKDVSRQDVGPATSGTTETSQQVSQGQQANNNDETQIYGRQTIGETRHTD